MEEADTLGDKIAIMALGRLRAVGDSLHLKTRYGQGYHINIVTEEKKYEELIKLIAEEFPRAKLTYQSAGNLIYTVPYSNYDDVTNFFEWIEHDAPYIVDWGVSHTTLEEVFLRITHGESQNDSSNIELSVKLDGIPDTLGSITLSPEATLAEARRLISALGSSPPFFQFVSPPSSSPSSPSSPSSSFIPVYQEHLKQASRFAPTLVIAEVDEQEIKKEEEGQIKNWEDEKKELVERYSKKIQELEHENAHLKARIDELERLINNSRK